MPKFLIVKASSLGDIIQAFPCASYLKYKFPGATIDWIVESSFAELVQAHPDINSIIPINTKIWRKNLLSRDTWKSIIDIKKQIQKETYDVVFDLQGNMKSGLMTYLSKAKIKVGLGWKSVSEKPNVLCTHQRFNFKESGNIRDDYLSIVQQYFQDSTPFESAPYNLKLSPEQEHLYQDTLKAIEARAEVLPKIMICPGSAWPNKQLTQEAMLDFLERIHQHTPSHFILIWGSSEEFKSHNRFINTSLSLLYPRLSLPVLQNLMNDMNLIIAVDSLPFT